MDGITQPRCSTSCLHLTDSVGDFPQTKCTSSFTRNCMRRKRRQTKHSNELKIKLKTKQNFSIHSQTTIYRHTHTTRIQLCVIIKTGCLCTIHIKLASFCPVTRCYYLNQPTMASVLKIVTNLFRYRVSNIIYLNVWSTVWWEEHFHRCDSL